MIANQSLLNASNHFAERNTFVGKSLTFRNVQVQGFQQLHTKLANFIFHFTNHPANAGLQLRRAISIQAAENNVT